MARIRLYKKGQRTRLTNNFWSTEMDCKCKDPECKWTHIDLDHIDKLQKMRDQWREPVNITSGYRCKKHNATVGGASQSRHLIGDATDIRVRNKTPKQVADDCDKSNFDGIGRYNTFTHLDSRQSKARWDFTKK